MNAVQIAVLTPSQIKGGYEKALAEFIDARQATLAVNLYSESCDPSMEGMGALHRAMMRFDAARENRTNWAQALAGS